MKNFIRESLHKLLMTLLLSVWALYMLQFATAVPLHMPLVLGVLFLWTVLMVAIDWLSRPTAVIILLFTLVTVAFAALGGAPLIEYTVALYSGGELERSFLGDTVVLLELAVFSCLAMYVCRNFWSRTALSLLWAVYWVWAALQETELPKIALAAIIPVMLFTLVEGIHRFRNKENKSSFALLAPVLMSLFAAVGVLLLLLPTSPEPYGYPVLSAIWEKVEDVYENTVTKLYYRVEGDEQFRMTFAGYSDEAETGEGVSSNSVDGAMLAKARHSLNENLYLIGNSWDTFSGRTWLSNVSEDAGGLLDWNMDTAERIYAVWRFQQTTENAGVSYYLKNTSVYLAYQDMRTRTLFTVPNTIKIATNSSRFPWSSEPGKVLFDYLQTKDTYYRIHYLAQNQRYLPEVIEASEGYAYDSENDLLWRTIFGAYRSSLGLTLDTFDTDRKIEPVMAQRQALIYETYLTLPEDISDRVLSLAEEITDGCDSSYEKLQAIAEYLQSNYIYTPEPAAIPEGTAFLDYVLFESQEGYCTWYATAAAMLARCAGIPARYVQGYCLQLEAGVLTAVEGTSSHAWCEGYIPGYGWITVEATPGFSNAGTAWEDISDDSGNLDAEGNEKDSSESEAVDTDDAADGMKREGFSVKYVGAAVFGSSLAVLLAIFLRQERSRRKYRAATYSGKVMLDLEHFLKSPVRREYRRQSSESLRQYLARLRWNLHLDPKLIDDMTVLYEEVLFAERELTEKEWKESRAFLTMLKKARRKQIWTY